MKKFVKNLPMDVAIDHYREQKKTFQSTKEMEAVDQVLENGNLRQVVLMADERGENNIVVKIPVCEYAKKSLEELFYGSRIKKLLHKSKFRIIPEEDAFRLCWNQKGEELNPPITY